MGRNSEHIVVLKSDQSSHQKSSDRQRPDNVVLASLQARITSRKVGPWHHFFCLSESLHVQSAATTFVSPHDLIWS